MREIQAVAIEIAVLYLDVAGKDLDVNVAVHVSDEAERLWP